LLVAGYWLLVTGCWLLVTGYWLLVAGYWLQISWTLLVPSAFAKTKADKVSLVFFLSFLALPA
jgi:hypothetical protein